MTQPLHTPGPWIVKDWFPNDPSGLITHGKDDTWVHKNLNIEGHNRIQIAIVGYMSRDAGFPNVKSLEEMHANARLIAAAPDLLEALKENTRWLEDMQKQPFYAEHSGLQNCIDNNHAAIAKARGQQ